MGVNYNFLYFSGDDSDYDVDSNDIDEELGRGTSSIVFFLTFLTIILASTLLVSISSDNIPNMIDEWLHEVTNYSGFWLNHIIKDNCNDTLKTILLKNYKDFQRWIL